MEFRQGIMRVWKRGEESPCIGEALGQTDHIFRVCA